MRQGFELLPSPGAARHPLPRAGEGTKLEASRPGLLPLSRVRERVPPTGAREGWHPAAATSPSPGAARHPLPHAGEGTKLEASRPGLLPLSRVRERVPPTGAREGWHRAAATSPSPGAARHPLPRAGEGTKLEASRPGLLPLSRVRERVPPDRGRERAGTAPPRRRPLPALRATLSRARERGQSSKRRAQACFLSPACGREARDFGPVWRMIS